MPGMPPPISAAFVPNLSQFVILQVSYQYQPTNCSDRRSSHRSDGVKSEQRQQQVAVRYGIMSNQLSVHELTHLPPPHTHRLHTDMRISW